MALKPSQITRRNFVQRAGLLVSALGVGAGVQSGLMDAIMKKATKKWGGEAFAATDPNAVAFHVEILMRAGFQANSLFPSDGHKNDTRNQALNIYSSAANITPLTIAGQNAAAKPAYIAKFTAGAGADALGTYLSSTTTNKNGIGLATSEAVQLLTGQHTGSFASRMPTSSAPAPAVLHAALGPSAPISGIEWNNGVSTTSGRGNLPALAQVKDQATFQGLYKDLPMYFTRDELTLIAGSFDATSGALTKAGVIDNFDAMFATKNVPGTADVSAVSVAGRNQAQLSVLAALQAKFNLITNNGAGGNFTNINQSMGGTQLGVALANAAAAFSAGLLTTFTVSLDSSDWHSDISALDDATSKQAAWNLYIGNALTGFLKSMDQLTSPLLASNTKPMSTSFLVSMSSEFTRTPNRNGGGAGSDNGDGGNASFMFLGSKVKSGSYGNITGAGGVVGFDPATGAMNAASAINEPMVWKTHGKLLGISDTTLNSYLPNVVGATGLVK
ncbi:MAG TPA: twin-arginine translocation signal domain-containing protein [bacterium]|nr:twin-arginine translocation signal domain-containing protein [bacterium]